MVAPKSPVTVGEIGSGNTLTIPAPANIAAGDVLVAFVRAQGSGPPDVAPPTGWARAGIPYDGGASGSRLMGTWTKTATASEPSSYTFTVTARAVGGISLWAATDIANTVVGHCIDYRGWWDGAANGRHMDAYTATSRGVAFVLSSTEAVAGVPHVPSVTPAGYAELLNHQTGTGITGSRTAIWVGFREIAGPVSPATEVLVGDAVVGWNGGTAGEGTQGLTLRAVAPAWSPFMRWTGTQYTPCDAFVWTGGGYVDVTRA